MADEPKRTKAEEDANQMTMDQREFLFRVADCDPYGLGRHRNLPEVTRESGRVRQFCRKKGWVEFKVARWYMTPAGRSVQAAVMATIRRK